MSPETNTLRHVEKWLQDRCPSEALHNARPSLTVVVPAFNEEWRLPFTLIDMIDFLDARGDDYEIIVVDDGSEDQTEAVVRKFEKIRSQVKLVKLARNCGKGCAVRTGVLAGLGQKILFADADGATPFSEIARLEEALAAGADVAFGSRAMPSANTRVTTRWYRKYLGRTFNLCVNWLVLPEVADTQCGFKMFSARSAKFLFALQRADRFSFDVELLFIAKRAGLKLAEVPVNWVNVPGSKVNLLIDALKMLFDLTLFKLRHRRVTPQAWIDFPA